VAAGARYHPTDKLEKMSNFVQLCSNGTWQEYKTGKIGKKELIKRALKGLGNKIISLLPRTAPALL